MDDKIIATFCLCDDLLKAMHHQEDRQCQMNDAEIMTTAFIASLPRRLPLCKRRWSAPSFRSRFFNQASFIRCFFECG